MKNLTVFILALLCLFVMLACQQEAPVSPLGEEYLAWNAFYERNGVQAQTFSMDAATGGTFEGEKGMTLIIPPDAFVDKFGLAVSGEVTLRFGEYTTLADMFLSGLNTMTHDQFLISAGSFKFEASQDGELLAFAHDKEAHVMIPQTLEVGDFEDEMYPFIWTEDAFSEDEPFLWRQISDWPILEDTAYHAYDMIFNDIGLLNCDAFTRWSANWGNTSFTDFKVRVQGIDLEHARVIFLVKELAGLVELNVKEEEAAHTYESSIPVGIEGMLLVVSMEGDKLMYGHQDIKVEGKESFDIEVKQGKEKELKAILDNPF